MRVTIACWLLLIALITLSIAVGSRPPAAVPAAASAAEFSSSRAMGMLEQFAQRPHPVGSAEHDHVRDFLVGALTGLHLEPSIETHTGTIVEGGSIIAAKVSNLVGRLPGTANSRAVVLTAHYDSVDRAPGAGDDGGGVAAILETVRAIEAGPRPRNDVVVLFTDGEEYGLLGAQAAAAHDPWLRDAGVLLNFEGRGDTGPSVLFETSDGNRGLVAAFHQAVPYPSGSSLAYTLYKQLPNDTDFTVFRKLGIAGLNFAWDAGLEAYHSRLDTPARLNPGSLQHDGAYALPLTRTFGNLDLNRFPVHDSQDAVFFNWFGLHLVSYPVSWVLPLALLATALFVGVLAYAIRRGALSAGGLGKGFAGSLVILLAPPLIMAAGFWCIDRVFGKALLVGDVPSNACLLLSLLLLGGAAATGVFAFFRSRWGVVPLGSGGLLLVWLLTAAMTLTLPSGSYLFFWPLVFAIPALAWMVLARSHSALKITAVAWVGAVPTILLFAPTTDQFFVGLTLGLMSAAFTGLLLGVAFLLLVPLVDLLSPARYTRRVLMALAACGVSLAVAGLVLSKPSATHPMPDTLVYSPDANAGKPAWVSYDTAPDPWTELKLTRSPHRGKLASFWRPQSDVLWMEAPPESSPLPASNVVVSQNSLTDGVRTLHFQIRPPVRKNEWISMSFEPKAKIMAATIDGERVEIGTAAPRSIGLFGYGEQGVDLTLQVMSRGCRASFADHFMELPPGVAPRPVDRMAWYGSDYTIVDRTITFC
jgi:hypothetical protein